MVDSVTTPDVEPVVEPVLEVPTTNPKTLELLEKKKTADMKREEMRIKREEKKALTLARI